MKRVARHARKYLVPHKSNEYRPYLLRSIGIAAILFTIFGTMFASQIHLTLLRGSNLLATVLPGVLVSLANETRAANNLPIFALNDKLSLAAEEKAKDMAAKGYFAHNSPEGVTPWYWITKAEYDFAYAGENLAVNFDDSNLVNDAWMNSPTHRANIMNGKFTEIGIGTASGIYKGRETTFVVQMFGAPAAPRQLATVSSPEILNSEISTRVVPVESERTLAPVVTSAVLGDTSEQTFVAVKDVNVEPVLVETNVRVTEPAITNDVSADLAASPSKLLGTIYMVIGAILGVVFISVLAVTHDKKKVHLAYVFGLVIFLAAIYYLYKSYLISQILVV